jgi:hypothetical protein
MCPPTQCGLDKKSETPTRPGQALARAHQCGHIAVPETTLATYRCLRVPSQAVAGRIDLRVWAGDAGLSGSHNSSCVVAAAVLSSVLRAGSAERRLLHGVTHWRTTTVNRCLARAGHHFLAREQQKIEVVEVEVDATRCTSVVVLLITACITRAVREHAN